MRCVTTVAQVRARVADARATGAVVGFVPTMGALHDGHLSLIRIAAGRADLVVVSIFVNPNQFDRPDDLDQYPKDLDADLEVLERLDVPVPVVVFAPEALEMYPPGAATTVAVGRLTETLCGRSRPGHFDGVATVVTRLLEIVRPDLAVFGHKDRQQLAVVRRLVEDLALDVEIVGGPTVREPDGLAMSSRNALLDASERDRARRVVAALAVAVDTARRQRAQGTLDPHELRTVTAATLDGLDVDYADVVDPDTFAALDAPVTGDGRVLVAVAVHVGGARLIDNVLIGAPDEEAAVLAHAGAVVPTGATPTGATSDDGSGGRS
ncbi:MAG: pantoate--beta-alanine ligase [Nitriliruptoraceae bacterium]